jgi:hypothetical protein
MRHAASKALGVLLLFAAFANALSQDVAVSWEGFVPIGGIEQWISIRGESSANPAAARAKRFRHFPLSSTSGSVSSQSYCGINAVPVRPMAAIPRRPRT